MLNQEELDYLKRCIRRRNTAHAGSDEQRIFNSAIAAYVPCLIKTIEALQGREKELLNTVAAAQRSYSDLWGTYQDYQEALTNERLALECHKQTIQRLRDRVADLERVCYLKNPFANVALRNKCGPVHESTDSSDPDRV